MIVLSKLDNSTVLVNLDAIKYMESTPDTLIHFLNGDSMLVKETLDDVTQRISEVKAKILAAARKQEA